VVDEHEALGAVMMAWTALCAGERGGGWGWGWDGGALAVERGSVLSLLSRTVAWHGLTTTEGTWVGGGGVVVVVVTTVGVVAVACLRSHFLSMKV
jgi:hypothetical protein